MIISNGKNRLIIAKKQKLQIFENNIKNCVVFLMSHGASV